MNTCHLGIGRASLAVVPMRVRGLAHSHPMFLICSTAAPSGPGVTPNQLRRRRRLLRSKLRGEALIPNLRVG